MKVFDYSPIQYNGGSLSLDKKILGVMKFGFSWINEMKSQEVVIQNLTKVLNKQFTLLRNISLPDTGIRIPLILIGPQGVSLIYPSTTKGMYRAKGDSWEVMDNRLRKFMPTKPNLITRTSLMARGVYYFLNEHGYSLDVQSVLVFTDSGTHIETERPAVRILMMDAIERFGSRLVQDRPVMSIEDVVAIKNTFDTAIEEEKNKAKEEEKNSSKSSQKISQTVDQGFSNILSPIQKKMNFNSNQWLLLGAFFLIEVLVLLAFLVFIILTA